MSETITEFSFPTDPDTICDTLYNTQTYFSRCVGYCTFHKGYLTAHQMKAKKCRAKNCDALIRQSEHEYWKNLERTKQEKMLKKEAQKREQEFRDSKKHLAATNKNETVQKKANPVQKKKRYICLDLEMCELTSKQRKGVKGLAGEVIQIGAVMLDESFNYLGEFSSLVKPVYGAISEEIFNLTGISNEMVANADTFSIAFYKFFCWAGNDDITTFCWSDSDYKQLWDEIYIKAKGHDEYREFLRTFVDLQAEFGKSLNAQKAISLDVALKFCHLKFKGQRHSALFDSFNTARILYKMKGGLKFAPKESWNYIASYTETEMSKKYFKVNSFDKDYTSSFASFVSPELLAQFGYTAKAEEKSEMPAASENKPTIFERVDKRISKFFICSHYGITVCDWLWFSVRMRFTRDMKMPVVNVG